MGGERGQPLAAVQDENDALDQGGLGVAPGVAHVDDERNPRIVGDDLCTSQQQTRCGGYSWPQRTRARSTALTILSCSPCECSLVYAAQICVPLSLLKAFCGCEDERRGGGVEGVTGRCRQLFGRPGASFAHLYCRARPALALHISPKMPLGPPTSAIYLQNTAPGFTVAPGYDFRAFAGTTSRNLTRDRTQAHPDIGDRPPGRPVLDSRPLLAEK